MTVAQESRDLEAVRAGLERWLRARHPDASDVRVAPLRKPTMGFSSETLLVDTARTESGRDIEEPFVARLPPAGGGIFPDYDLGRQASVQDALTSAGVPVARVIAVETDDRWVGAPFLAMERVDGATLEDRYISRGALHDASPDVQRRVHADFVDLLATVHSVDWAALGLGALTPEHERGLAHDIDRADDYLAWATDGDAPPVLRDAIAWLRERRPVPEPPLSLCWGDPRLGNVIYDDDFGMRAALDWESAWIGAAEHDLAWFVALHELAAQASRGDLPGLLAHDEVLARWSDRVGRAILDYEWFEVMSVLRSETTFLRIRRMMLAAGHDAPWLHGETPGWRLIAARIDAP